MESQRFDTEFKPPCPHRKVTQVNRELRRMVEGTLCGIDGSERLFWSQSGRTVPFSVVFAGAFSPVLRNRAGVFGADQSALLGVFYDLPSFVDVNAMR